MSMTFGSLFAGIGGFDLGYHQAGMRCAWQVEIDASARSVLAHHWSDVPRLTDVRECGAHNLAPVDVICGGFPCQDLSVAGNRAGLAGKRSGLFYQMTRIVNELRPLLLTWENVPGLLSSNRGGDFAAVLMELERIGYVGGWTTLDAQWFGVAQRRQRIFGVFARADLGAERCAEILSLRSRMPGHSETRPAARTDVAARTGISFKKRGGFGWSETAGITATLESEGGTHQGGPERVPLTLVASALSASHGGADDNDAQANHLVAVSVSENQRGELRTSDIAAQLTVGGGKPGQGYSAAMTSFGVRRLTPTECERLQGFPDDWTADQSDSARYRQLGNAVAVPVARWLGRQIVRYLFPAG